MNQFQKTVKYLAMAFAIFLTCTIIYLVISTIGFAVNIFDFAGNWTPSKKDNKNTLSGESFTDTYDDIEKIYIEHGVGKLTIKPSDTEGVSVYISDLEDYYKVTNTKKTLKVENKFNKDNFFDFGFRARPSQQVEVIINLPEDYGLKDLDIQAGAGEIILEDFVTGNLSINAGAGAISVAKVVAGHTDIVGGVGELKFRDVEFNSGDISTGVGRLNFSGELKGQHTIEAGVGEINFDIQGKLEDYDLSIDKGLGKIQVNGKGYKDVNFSQSQTDNSLDISGGVGSININFTE